jgi:probable phosphoglycerate mutase
LASRPQTRFYPAVQTTRLIALRHGETVWNTTGQYQGQLDSALTEIGLEQSRALATRLAQVPFAALYSSDLGRARQTAQIIAERTGHAVQFDARLRERSLGVFQGFTRAEVKEKFPDEYRWFKEGGWDYVVPGGESARQSIERIVTCLDELARKHPGQQFVAITHGGVLGGFLRHVLGVPPDLPRYYKRFNASWNVFAWENGGWLLETWGDVSHLDRTLSLDDV